MPPVPTRVLVPVLVSAFLSNTGQSDESLFAPTPCDVHSWELLEGPTVIQAEEPEICVDVVATRTLAAGVTIRGDNSLPLNGRLLKNGRRYTVRYKFWGHEATDAFVAHVVV
jgi:hypothetical protein